MEPIEPDEYPPTDILAQLCLTLITDVFEDPPPKKLIGIQRIFIFFKLAERENFSRERRKPAAANWINQTRVCV